MENELKDAVRELEKALQVMAQVDEYFHHQASMNAALHMSERVIPNPLASAVATSLQSLDRSVKGFNRLLAGEVPLPLDEEGFDADAEYEEIENEFLDAAGA